uniref:RHS repeat domain-containing protein n=1 Tax=Paenibacillus sp. FSL W8-0194 TaxID=2921711 RepID=UPI00403E3AA9
MSNFSPRASGSALGLVEKDGRVSARYHYDEFGIPLDGKKFDLNWPGPDNLFGYTGLGYGYTDGLTYARARYYQPEIGRFISEDTYKGTLGNPLSQNLYAYVENNPLIYVDPSGHAGRLFDFRGGSGGARNFGGGVGSIRVTNITPKLSSGPYKVSSPSKVVVKYSLNNFPIKATPNKSYFAPKYLKVGEVANKGTGEVAQKSGSLKLICNCLVVEKERTILNLTPMQPETIQSLSVTLLLAILQIMRRIKTQTNPINPNPFEFEKRYDGVGGSHYDKATGQDVPTPHVHEATNPGGARAPYPDEIPIRR